VPSDELHDLPPEVFQEHVRSFEYWFGAVQGYLEGRSFGHSPGAAEGPARAEDRERLISVLCNYCVGETAALEGAGGLIRLAPNRSIKVFLSTQTVDEGRHLEVLTHRLRELGVEDPEVEIARRAHPSLVRFKERLLQMVQQGAWSQALFAQNVILESMEFTAFRSHIRQADPVTREVLIGIVKDERRHIGFGENELGRLLARGGGSRADLAQVRRELDPLVLESFRDLARELDVGERDRVDLTRDYLAAVGRLGVS
jgi:1,2-phenylacetyl-CoA epoxidase catalytic subunit